MVYNQQKRHNSGAFCDDKGYPRSVKPSPVIQDMDMVSKVLKAMGNRHRLLILCLLSTRERHVGELENIVGLSQSALSQHLARLRRDGLVKTRRMAQNIHYSLADDCITPLLASVGSILESDCGCLSPIVSA